MSKQARNSSELCTHTDFDSTNAVLRIDFSPTSAALSTRRKYTTLAIDQLQHQLHKYNCNKTTPNTPIQKGQQLCEY